MSIEDVAIGAEASRRAAWAKYYALRDELQASEWVQREVLRRMLLELARAAAASQPGWETFSRGVGAIAATADSIDAAEFPMHREKAEQWRSQAEEAMVTIEGWFD